LLADHPDDDQWELVYLGVAPESRGQGLGMALARKALAMARRAGRRQLVLAVDAANAPAIEIYRRAGFEAWERRRIFLRRFDKPREM
jgi:ribosomal protein S18 acetylase RimI-like enzyme